MGDILVVQPFGNNVDIVNINGSTIRKVLEHAVAKYDKLNRRGEFLQVSGKRLSSSCLMHT